MSQYGSYIQIIIIIINFKKQKEDKSQKVCGAWDGRREWRERERNIFKFFLLSVFL